MCNRRFSVSLDKQSYRIIFMICMMPLFYSDRRRFVVTKGVMTLMKGMAAGMAAGVAAGAAGAIMLRDSRKNRKRFAKAVNAVENVLDTVTDMFS